MIAAASLQPISPRDSQQPVLVTNGCQGGASHSLGLCAWGLNYSLYYYLLFYCLYCWRWQWKRSTKARARLSFKSFMWPFSPRLILLVFAYSLDQGGSNGSSSIAVYLIYLGMNLNITSDFSPPLCSPSPSSPTLTANSKLVGAKHSFLISSLGT